MNNEYEIIFNYRNIERNSPRSFVEKERRIQKVLTDIEKSKKQSLTKLEKKNEYIEKIRLQNEELMNKRLKELKSKNSQAEERLKKRLEAYEREAAHKKVS